MATWKRLFLIWFQVALCVIIVFSSCKNTSDHTELIPPETKFAQPVVQPLKFSNARKINWDTIKAVKVHPIVKKLNWDKLPQQRYDTSDFKPFKYPVEETKFDYNALPSKDLDIDKLPSHALKFKTYTLPPPKLIKGAKLQFKTGNLFVFNFAEAQGKQGIMVSDSFYDRDGFLWIATPRGVYRYDGENLLLFFSDPKMPLRIWGMVQDSDGNIWISADDSGGGFGGIMVLYPKSGILKKSGIWGGLNSKNAMILMKDKQQRIWVTSWWSPAINIIDPKKQTVKLLDKTNGLSSPQGTDAIAMDKSDNIWISSFGSGSNIIDLKNKKIKYMDKAHGLKTDLGSGASFDGMGRIWTGADGGLINVLDLKKNTFQTIRETQHTPYGVYPELADDKGRFWVSTPYDGLFIIDLKKRMIKHLKLGARSTSDHVSNITKGIKNQLWLATSYGLNMISDDQAVVEHIGSDSVFALTEDRQGLIWKSTARGIDILDRKTKISRHLGLKQGLEDDYIDAIKEKNGAIFIRTDSAFEIVDSARKTIANFGTKQGLGVKRISDFSIDKACRIWIAHYGTNDGIVVCDPWKRTLKRIGKAQGLMNPSDVFDMCFDKDGCIWATLDKGEIDKIDPNAGTIQILVNPLNFKYNAIKEWLPDSKGNIWFGTYKGIYIADLKNQKLVSFTTAQGLINNKVLSLTEREGRVYAGTNEGITVITPPAEGVSANKKWKVESHGLNKIQTDNFNGDLVTKAGLYLSADIGINVLDLSKIDKLNQTPYVTGISVYDNPIYFVDKARFNSAITDTLWEPDEKKYYLKNKLPVDSNNAVQIGLKWDSLANAVNMPVNLQVPFDQNFIRFYYSSFNYEPHDTASYKYILIGGDKHWSGTTSEGSSKNYMNLKPGKYTFEVISRNADNIWSQPAKFSFTINPPWWQTWWACMLYAGLFTGTIWCFVYFRSRQLVKDKRRLEKEVNIRTEEVLQQKEEIEAQRDKLEMEKIRSDIAADFHDELGSTLSSIALYSEMAMNDNFEDKQRTKNILSLIGESSRGTVSAMQDMIWTIQPKNDSMREVIYRMREYAYPLAELKNITLTLAAAEDVQAMILPMEIRKNIYLIFKEALNNAFKYAAASAIGIKLVKEHNVLRLEIKDDGAGFDVSDARTGNGLINMHKRADQTGGTLLVKSCKGSGTEILFSCPVN